MQHRTDVLIIGAGISGLTAAWRLQRAGVDAAVVEARDHTGGRLQRPPGSPLDLGASWVWDTERHIHGLLRELRLETFPHHQGDDNAVDVYDNGQSLQRGRFPRSHVPERRLRGGTQIITDALTERVQNLHLSQPARAISAAEDTDTLLVETGGGEWRAKHVLLALPPALAANHIAMPDVPGDRLAMMRETPTWMADIAKVVIEYPTRFWRDAGLSGRGASARGPMGEIHDLSGPDGTPAALFGFVPRQLATDGWRDRLVPQLVHLFGPGAAAPSALHIKAWWEEPWTFAGGRNGDQRLFGHPTLREPLLGGRLHLISTETAGVSTGHLDGAVERAQAVSAHLLSTGSVL